MGAASLPRSNFGNGSKRDEIELRGAEHVSLAVFFQKNKVSSTAYIHFSRSGNSLQNCTENTSVKYTYRETLPAF